MANITKETKDDAFEFLASMRGSYIISQALWKAIEVMRADKHPETSNIQDMEFLRKNIFNMYIDEDIIWEDLLNLREDN